MKKSVYSLVLSDDVVKAADAMAYAAGLSRSSFINSVLAEAVSYVTPEKRMNDIFSEIAQLMDIGTFKVKEQPSDAMLSIRSAVQYRYKPVIRYSLELFRDFEKTIGRLKVSFRTQSQGLISDFESFLGIWIGLEKQYMLKYFPEGISYTIEAGKFTRTLCLPPDKKNITNEEAAQAISGYIKIFDDVLKVYFANIGDPSAAALAAQRYREYVQNGMTVI